MTRHVTTFAVLPATAQYHFRLYYFAAVARVLKRVSAIQPSAFEEFPFLAGYHDELAALGAYDRDDGFWQDSIAAWERRASGHLPIGAA